MYQNRIRPGSQKSSMPRGFSTIALLFVVAVVLAGGLWWVANKNKAGDAPKTADQTVSFDKQKNSLTDPASPWLVVNKKRQLSPKEYEPADLRTPEMNVESANMKLTDATSTALEILARAASKEGIDLVVASAYRSYPEQSSIYNSMVKGYGQEQADRESARPGHSEHQTGMAVDLGAANGKCRIEACFADTPEGKWLAANAYKYGFIIRYADGKEQVTGYNYEPWHLRYVGTELSIEMHRTGIKTLEEFFGLPAAPSY